MLITLKARAKARKLAVNWSAFTARFVPEKWTVLILIKLSDLSGTLSQQPCAKFYRSHLRCPTFIVISKP